MPLYQIKKNFKKFFPISEGCFIVLKQLKYNNEISLNAFLIDFFRILVYQVTKLLFRLLKSYILLSVNCFKETLMYTYKTK
jgi:hypothetical protein